MSVGFVIIGSDANRPTAKPGAAFNAANVLSGGCWPRTRTPITATRIRKKGTSFFIEGSPPGAGSRTLPCGVTSYLRRKAKTIRSFWMTRIVGTLLTAASLLALPAFSSIAEAQMLTLGEVMVFHIPDLKPDADLKAMEAYV